MQIIAIANHKGGCGKTTTSIHFAACLAQLEKTVLLVDLDPQGHSTCGLGIKAEELSHTLYDFMHGAEEEERRIEDFLRPISPNFKIFPSYGILSAIEEELSGKEDRYECLSRRLLPLLKESNEFDYVIFDCPPNLGVLTYNALEIADEVIIPIEPSFFSLHGLGKITETIYEIRDRLRKDFDIHALLTIFDSSLSFSEEIYEEIKDHFGKKLFKSIIHTDVAFKEAAAYGQSITEYAPESNAYQDYMKMTMEYLEREWDRLLPAKQLGWDQVFYHHYGPKKVSGGILFQAKQAEARWVEIAGDFNNWIPEPMVRRDEPGLWQKVIPIESGAFRYKYIVDGEWQIDPYQPTQANDFGGQDSYLEIA